MAKPIVKLIFLLVLGAFAFHFQPVGRNSAPEQISSHDLSGLTDPAIIQQAFDNQRSNIQVKQSGQVAALLKDDRHGSLHQRFIIRLNSGQKLLIAHNIDLAPRIDNLNIGDQVTFFGEYEWNNKGGVIHWTHRDPKRRHC